MKLTSIYLVGILLSSWVLCQSDDSDILGDEDSFAQQQNKLETDLKQNATSSSST